MLSDCSFKGTKIQEFSQETNDEDEGGISHLMWFTPPILPVLSFSLRN